MEKVLFRGNHLSTRRYPSAQLLHYSITLNIKGESYCLKEKGKAGLLGRPSLEPVTELEISDA